MKLLNKYNRISLVTTGIVIIIAGLVYYYTISAILTAQIDKDLRVEENEIFDYVHLNHQLPQVFRSTDQQIYFTEVGQAPVIRRFISTDFYNVKEQENEAGRGLISSVVVNGKRYRIKISKSTVETEDLIRIIFLITLGLIVLLILVLFIINRLALKKLWSPFYRTLREVKLFNLTDKKDLPQTHTNIDEFNELNSAVSTMAARATHDYQELKGFIQNASHELMTPIAVINSKLDTLIQTEQFNQRQSELLNDVYATVSRLTRLNKAMLLLTKIENRLINDSQTFDAKDSVEDALSLFHELFIDKGIIVHTTLTGKQLTMSKPLFDVLLNNLLSNALRHNTHGGTVEVELSPSALIVKNTGRLSSLNPESIFHRFNKSAESEGIGLGLTLSKQICENYHFSLTYSYSSPLHIFKIEF